MRYIKSKLFKIITSVLLVYSLLGFFILPYMIQSNTSKILKTSINSKAYIGAVFINPFTFEVKLKEFLLKDQNNKNLVYFKKFAVDIDIVPLFSDQVLLKYIDLENLTVDVDFDKNKVSNFQYILDFLEENKTDSNSTNKETKVSNTIVTIEKLNIIKTNLIFTDDSKSERFYFRTKPFDIVTQNIQTSKNHINNISLDIDTFSTGTIKLNSDFVLSPLSASGDFSLEKININKIFSYVKDGLDFEIDAGKLDFALNYKYKKELEKQKVNISDIKLDIDSLNYIAKQQEVKLDLFNHTIKDINLLLDENITYDLNNVSTNINKIVYKDINKDHELAFKSLKTDVEKISSNTNDNIKLDLSIYTPSKGIIKTYTNIIREPFLSDANISIQNLDITPYEIYIKDFANIDLHSTDFSTLTNVKISKENNSTNITAKSDLSIKDINISHSLTKKPIFSLKELQVNKVYYTNDNIFIKDILIDTPSTIVKIAKDKTTNLDNISISKVDDTKKNIDTNKTKKESILKYFVGKISIKDGKSDFSDLSLPLPFATKIHDINSEILAVSSKKDESTKINLQGIIDKYAVAKIDANVITSNPFDNTTFDVNFENIDVTSFSPYSGKFIGQEIGSGKLWLDLKYDIINSKLSSTNKLKIKDLELGDEVESNTSMSLPVGLAIALLKDSDGFIDLALPIDGDVENPNFHFGGVVLDVLTNTITSIVSAPFKFLGSLLGLDEDELSTVEFDYGSAIIQAHQKEKLDKLLEAFKKRPNIALSITPSYVKYEDKHQIQKIKFSQKLSAKIEKKSNKRSKNEFLKEFYIEQFSKKEFAKIKSKEKNPYPTIEKILISNTKVTNQELNLFAKQRALNINHYLVKHGLDKSRVIIKKEIKENIKNDLQKVTIELGIEIKDKK